MKPRGHGRRTGFAVGAVGVVAVLVSLLAGCSGVFSTQIGSRETIPPTPTPTAPTCVNYPGGSAVSAVSVSGAQGATPKVTFSATPLPATTAIQRAVPTPGSGRLPTYADQENVFLTVLSAATGKQIASQAAQFTPGKNLVGIEAAINCLPAGARSVTVAPPDTMFGAQGNTQAGVQANETLVLVIDVVSITPAPNASSSDSTSPSAAPDPTAETWTTNVPDVTFNGTTPTVTIPKVKPSPDLEIKILTQGDGATVKAGDTVTVDYQGLTWADNKVFDQSYGKSPASFSTSGVITGFRVALVGQKVGTTLIVTIPPEYAYGNTSSNGSPSGTLVFVIAIQGTKSS